MANNIFKKAKKEGVWVRILLGGPSGSGKTYSGLRLASGLAEACGSRVAAIDTENGRMKYYAEEFDFDHIEMDAPFSPSKYIEYINAAVSAGYKVLLIDSSSHEWKWCYDTVNAMSGNSFQNWGKIKANHHQKFTEAIIQSPIHIIVTARGKDEYVMDDKDGKKNPRKVGLGIKQEDDTEYEYTATFNISQDTHIASAMKDNTHLFENRWEVLTEKDGAALYNWANSGGTPSVKKVPAAPKANTDELGDTIAKIKAAVAEKTSGGIEKDVISETIKGIAGFANYNKIVDSNTAVKVLEALNNLEGDDLNV